MIMCDEKGAHLHPVVPVPEDAEEFQFSSTDQLDPRRGDDKLQWLRSKLKDRKEHICRKKTLLKRLPVLHWLPHYTASDVVPDLLAGITVGITALPQALAYATLAGLSPQYGLYSAYMGSFVYMILGSTRVITIGPSSLLSLLCFDAVTTMGPGAAILLAFISGSISVLVGLLNLGFLIEFIAAPVIGGFTTAAAIATIMTQIKSLFGLSFSANGFIETWAAVFDHIGETRLWDAVMGFSCIVALLLLRLSDRIKLGEKGHRTVVQRYLNRFFWFLAAARNAVIIILATGIAAGVSTPGADDNPLVLTGNITSGMPLFQLPPFFIENGNETFTFTEICSNLGSSLYAVPLISILESVGIAKAFAKGQKIDASQEMIAIGASNLVGSFVGSYPVTGSFSRTAINAASGVRSPLGGIYTGALVLLSISVLTPYFYYIPKAALAAAIVVSMIFMIEIHLFKMIWRTRKIDVVPMLVTFVICLLLSLQIGILVGTGVNLAMLCYSTARPKIHFHKRKDYLLVTPDRSLVFTSMDYFVPVVRKASMKHPESPVVIDLGHASTADFSTAFGFKNLTEDLMKSGHEVIITRAEPKIVSILIGINPKIHVHAGGTDLSRFIHEIMMKSASESTVSVVEVSLPSILPKETGVIEDIHILSATKVQIE